MFENKLSIFQRIKNGLKKTRNNISGKIKQILPANIDVEEKLENLEETLIEADIGVEISMAVIDYLRKNKNLLKKENEEELFKELKNFLIKYFSTLPRKLKEEKPLTVLMFTGINGTGKTTSMAKIANYLKKQNKKVMFAACDTFRAAAIEQILLWGEKLNVPVIKGEYGADAASIAYDAIDSSLSKSFDYLLVDTAGRLHSRIELMEELKKIIRVTAKKIPIQNMEKIFVLDGTTGQNGLVQAEKFNDTIGIDSVIVTKLDGTAKGGILLSIENKLKTPVKFIGVGEEMEDLILFNPEDFIDAIFTKNE